MRTTLGPKSMLKMLLDPMGGIIITNDGNAILREIDVSHPAAKSMLELARSQVRTRAEAEVGESMRVRADPPPHPHPCPPPHSKIAPRALSFLHPPLSSFLPFPPG